MTKVKIKGLLTFNEVILGLRVVKLEDLQNLDMDKDVLTPEAQTKLSTSDYPKITLIEKGDKLVSEEEYQRNETLPLIDTRNDIVTEVENILLGVQPSNQQTTVAKAKPQEKAKPSPTATQSKDGEVKAEPKKKTKFYTVLLSVKTLTADGQGIEDREVKRDVEDTNLTNAKMQIREVVAKEYDIPMKDVKVLKAGVKK